MNYPYPEPAPGVFELFFKQQPVRNFVDAPPPPRPPKRNQVNTQKLRLLEWARTQLYFTSASAHERFPDMTVSSIRSNVAALRHEHKLTASGRRSERIYRPVKEGGG